MYLYDIPGKLDSQCIFPPQDFLLNPCDTYRGLSKHASSNCIAGNSRLGPLYDERVSCLAREAVIFARQKAYRSLQSAAASFVLISSLEIHSWLDTDTVGIYK